MTTRATMIPAGRRWRAYFAPVERASQAPAAFDAAQGATFALDSPPASWVSLGWIENFARRAATELVAVRAGARQGLLRQARKNLHGEVEFDFCDWGKLQLALSAGSEHFNVLAGSAVVVGAGSTAGRIFLDPAALAGFAAGDLVAVDLDYASQTGYVGTGIAGAYVADAASISDAGYIRRVSFNVARVMSKDATSLLLEQPLLGGAPAANAKLQKVAGFTDREGGAFFQEWSGLFLFESESGGRVALYYPRLQAAAPVAEARLELAEPLRGLALHARFTALAVPDAGDAQPCVCWRTYYPAASAPIL